MAWCLGIKVTARVPGCKILVVGVRQGAQLGGDTGSQCNGSAWRVPPGRLPSHPHLPWRASTSCSSQSQSVIQQDSSARECDASIPPVTVRSVGRQFCSPFVVPISVGNCASSRSTALAPGPKRWTCGSQDKENSRGRLGTNTIPSSPRTGYLIRGVNSLVCMSSPTELNYSV